LQLRKPELIKKMMGRGKKKIIDCPLRGQISNLGKRGCVGGKKKSCRMGIAGQRGRGNWPQKRKKDHSERGRKKKKKNGKRTFRTRKQ